MASIDDLDRQIIQLLQEDGRASNTLLARSVQVSEGTVRRRLKRLIGEGIVKIAVTPNLQLLGYRTEALVGIRVDPDRIDAVAERLVALKPLSLVTQTTGAFDFFVWIALHSSADLGRFLIDEMGAIPGVRATQTFLSLSVRKRTHSMTV